MATNTCISLITYQNESDLTTQPFLTERDAKALSMFDQGKTESYPNWVPDTIVIADPAIGSRVWVDHAAAQEFIDWVIASAPTHNVTIVSSSIEDLPPV